MSKKPGTYVRVISVIVFSIGIIIVFFLGGIFDIDFFKSIRKIGYFLMIIGALFIGVGFHNPNLR